MLHQGRFYGSPFHSNGLYPLHIDICSKYGIVHFVFYGIPGQDVYNDVLSCMKIVFLLANSADPDEMLLYAAFHVGLFFLPK